VSGRFVGKAWELLEGGEFREAVGLLRRGLLADPKRLDGRLLLGAALVALGRFREAAHEVRLVLEVEPNSAAAHALMGEALLRRGDYARAVESFHRAQQLEPEDETIQALLLEANAAAATARPETATSQRGPRTAEREAEVPTRRYPIAQPPGAPSEARSSADDDSETATTLRFRADRDEPAPRLTKPYELRAAMRALDYEVANRKVAPRKTKIFGVPANSPRAEPDQRAGDAPSPPAGDAAPLPAGASAPLDDEPTQVSSLDDEPTAVSAFPPSPPRPRTTTPQFAAVSGVEPEGAGFATAPNKINAAELDNTELDAAELDAAELDNRPTAELDAAAYDNRPTVELDAVADDNRPTVRFDAVSPESAETAHEREPPASSAKTPKH
jgi:tetratricopeptide (TPR) repeat protein